FGKRNAGKSSLVNAVTGQDLAVVSEVKGTTTDPVYKAMELLPLGPVMIIDTPGTDDEGTLGELRVRKARQVLNKADLAVLVIDATVGKTREDEELLRLFKEKKVNYLMVYNKADLLGGKMPAAGDELYVSAKTGFNIERLKEKMAALAKAEEPKGRIVGDLINPLDVVVLVTPIDKAAPKGRLILPQQQTIRDILDSGAVAVVVKETEFSHILSRLGQKPKLVITDSQVFRRVAAETPPDIPLTSFSILFARYKGHLDIAVKGVKALATLQDGDTVLIAEGCTHHRQCEDIGTVKLPRWIREHTQKELHFAFTSGTEFPEDLSPYRLVIHCGGCMLNEREMKYRQQSAVDQQVPVTNYGMVIAYINGILPRSLAVFPQVLAELER
ncbi:MAG TPA: [FeFe] hydrogenase H-cluster maturation GTPase HydF, partial [Clostridia bacterium]|nr:[FeFe] hydrogenase H-cluster maturation GTPase HydF [Clostridia bacterium]